MNPVSDRQNLRLPNKRPALKGPTQAGSVKETVDLNHNSLPNRRGYLYQFKKGCGAPASSRPVARSEDPFSRETQVRKFSALAEAIGRAVNRTAPGP